MWVNFLLDESDESFQERNKTSKSTRLPRTLEHMSSDDNLSGSRSNSLSTVSVDSDMSSPRDYVGGYSTGFVLTPPSPKVS